MKHYTIKINNKNNNNFSFRNLFSNPSKDLDDLILSNMKKMNPYININTGKKDLTLDAMFRDAGFDTDDRIIIPNSYSYRLENDIDIDFIKAAAFLSSYTPTKKSYILFDGTPIGFFEDEIQIGNTLIPLNYLTNKKYYTSFTPEIKKTIINIFISINR